MTTTTTTQQEFSAMRGHVADGVSVMLDCGETVYVRAAWGGWDIVTDNGARVCSCGPSAAVVEREIIQMGNPWDRIEAREARQCNGL